MDFDDIYGRIITTTGWTLEYVDEMSLPQVYGLFAYWQRSPPVHELVAAFVGYKYEKPREFKGEDFPIHELFADIDMVNSRS